MKDSIGKVEIETANGVIETEVYEVRFFECLGLVRENFQVQAYDFLAHGILSAYNGLVGLDFFKGTDFCVNLNDNTISIR